MRGEQVKSLSVENQIGQAVIEQQVKNQEANHKAASNYEAKRAHIEASKVKAQRELKEVFDELRNVALLMTIALLTSCSTTKTVYVPAPANKLPANLVAECKKPVITTEWVNGREIVTVKTMAHDLTEFMAALADCGAKVDEIRELQK